MLEQGKVYVVAGGQIKPANKRFSTLKNEYSIIMGFETTVTLVPDDNSIDQIHFAFVPIRDIQDVEANSTVDVLGAVVSVEDPVDIRTKSGKDTCKRNVTIIDTSRTAITLTLWGTTAQNFTGQPGNTVALKAARVSDFNGRSLSTMQSTVMELNPANTDAYNLSQWYQTTGAAESSNYESLTQSGYGGGGFGEGGKRKEELKCFAEVQEANIGQKEEREFYSVRATISLFRRKNFSYPACPSAEV
jgi:replication factor A1